MDLDKAKEILKIVSDFGLYDYFSNPPELGILDKIQQKAAKMIYDDVCDQANLCHICGAEKMERHIRTYHSYNNPDLVIDIPFMGCENDECEYNKQEGEKAEYEYRIIRKRTVKLFKE
jgi:hypothetical protein